MIENYPRIFPQLYDTSGLIQRAHPENEHPRSNFYQTYWESVERKCIEGCWFLDKEKNKGGWRYGTPQLYFFLNCMKVPVQKGKNFFPELPSCHDIELIQSYNWLACRGFSGFDNDTKRSCFRPLKKLHTGEELDEQEQYLLEITPEEVYRYKGKLKQYVSAVEYLYNVHPEAMGLPEYYNTALDDMVFGSRGGAKTTFNTLYGYHEYTFYGCTRYDSNYIDAPLTSKGQRIFIASSVEKNVNDIIRVFELNINYHKNGLGSYRGSDGFYPGIFAMNAVGKLESNNVKAKYRHIINYSLTDTTGKKVTTSIESGAELNFAVETTLNPAPAVGGRYSVKIKDEIGKNANFKLGFELEQPTQIVDYKFGSTRASGTSGELDKIGDARYYFYNPDTNDILSFPNVYEPGGGNIAFFLSSILTDRKFKDEVGNTQYDKALKFRYERREKFKDDYEKLLFDKLNYPIYPSEMFGSNVQSVLPKAKAAQHLIYLDRTKEYLDFDTGTFDYDEHSQTVKWNSKPENKSNILTEHEPQKKGKSLYGGIAIYEHPVKNLPERRLYHNLHKAVCDVLQLDGVEGKVSLFCGYVYKGIPSAKIDSNSKEGTIVASVILRRNEVEAGLEYMFHLCLYYNCYLFYEGNIGPTTVYARLRGWSYLLQPTPTTALANGVSADGKTGMIMNTEKLDQALRWFNEFLLTAVDKDENSEEVLRINTIKCRMLIEQISLFFRAPKLNFDCISCMCLLMFWLKAEMEGQVASEEVVSLTHQKFLEYFKSNTDDTLSNISEWISI